MMRCMKEQKYYSSNINMYNMKDFLEYIKADEELQELLIRRIAWYRRIEDNQKKYNIEPIEDDIIELHTILSNIEDRYNLLTEIYLLGKIEKD